MPTVQTLPIAVAGFECEMALVLAVFLFISVQKVRGTTLLAPCLWAVISAICLAISAKYQQLYPQQTITQDAFHFIAAISTFCPIMAVLGAKRPQNTGWQWIVLSLWAITCWPAIQAVMLPASNQLELFIVWKIFLVSLFAIGLLNYLPTRFILPSLLVATGQFVQLDQFLWKNYFLSSQYIISIICFYAAFALATFLVTQTKHRSSLFDNKRLSEYELTWLNFRNAYGAFWALRILARVNETAELRQWPFRLTWAGFEPHPLDTNETPSDADLAELDQTLSTLLRRFNKLPDTNVGGVPDADAQ